MNQFSRITLPFARVASRKFVFYPRCYITPCLYFHLAPDLKSTHLNIKYYQSSTQHLAKQKKGGKKNSNNNNDGEEVQVELPSLNDVKNSMEKRIFYMNEEFSKIQASRPSIEMFSSVFVDIDGQKTNISTIGQVSLKGGNKILISLYDPTFKTATLKALRESSLNITADIEGSNISVSIPKSSLQARNELVKLASKAAEKAKSEIRNVRKDYLDEAKQLKGTIPDDENRRFTKEVDSTAEKFNERVAKLLKDKEKELLSM